MNNVLSQADEAVVAGRAKSRLRDVRLSGAYTSIWIATAALFALSAIFVPRSMTAQSLNAMIPFAAILAIAAIGQTLIIQQRGIDLSVPGIMTLTSMAFVTFVDRHDSSIVVAIIVMLAVGAIAGLANGLIIARLNVTPLITTLAMNSLLIGAMYSYTNGVGASATSGFQQFAAEKLLGISILAWIAVGLTLAIGFVSMQTKIGRRFVAVGASPVAARALGVRVNWYVIGAYVIGGMLFALAAVLLAGYIQTPTPKLGDPYLFQTVMAVVIGGTSVAGGRGSVTASFVAALFLTQLGQVALTLGASSAIQGLVQAGAMAAAVGFAALVASRRGRSRGAIGTCDTATTGVATG